MPAATVIQSQPGPDGSQVDLLSVKVTGDILTVAMRCSSPERYNRESIRVAQVSVIDDATSQRIGVLKDNEGNAMVSNLVRSSSPENDKMMVDRSEAHTSELQSLMRISYAVFCLKK